MRRVGKKSAVFDVPEEMRGQMDKLVNASKQEGSPIQDYEVMMVNSMEMLSDDEDDREAEPDEDFDDRDVRNAMKNKRDF